MIELRWAQRVGRNPRAGPRTVLEYRVMEKKLDSDDYRYMDWSEWRRVPTVWLGRSPAAREEVQK